MKLILAPTYDIDLKNWDINCINNIVITFGKISKGIHLQLQYLQANK